MSDVLHGTVGLVAIIVIIALYFLPSLVAMQRQVPNVGTVLVLNLFLGCTFVGWVLALALACGPQRHPVYVDDETS